MISSITKALRPSISHLFTRHYKPYLQCELGIPSLVQSSLYRLFYGRLTLLTNGPPPFTPSGTTPSTGPSLIQNFPVYGQAHHHDPNQQPPVPANHTPQSLGTPLPNFHLSFPTMDTPMASGEDLFDITQADMGWDFDFSTMDLETFLSAD